MRDHSNIREVMSDADFERWYDLYDDIFFDPADREDRQTVYRRWCGKEARARLFLIQDEAHDYADPALRERFGKSVGIVLATVDSRIPAFAYVPYGGLHKEARGVSQHKRSVKLNALDAFEEPLREAGVKIVLIDCEDPERADKLVAAYADKHADRFGSPKDVARYCAARLYFFARRGYSFIYDQEVKYCRPASDEPVEGVQDYDVLGFKVIAEQGLDDPYVRNHLDIRRTSFDSYVAGKEAPGHARQVEVTGLVLSKDSYRSLYTVLHTLDSYEPSGVFTGLRVKLVDHLHWPQEWSLRRRFKGAREFYRRLRQEGGRRRRFIAYDQSSLTRRTTPRFAVANIENMEIERLPLGSVVLWRALYRTGGYTWRAALDWLRGQVLKAALVLAASGIAWLTFGSGRLPDWLVGLDNIAVDWLRQLF